jgi:hypothetical protein
MGIILLLLILAGMTCWGALAIYYSNLPAKIRPIAAALFPLSAFAALVVWWLLIPPSNDREWQPDVAVLPHADLEGNKIAVHNIRNCDYRSETDYDVHYYDKTFDLDKLQTADLFFVYWGLPIAHTMMSFGFEGGDYLCISIETRK